MNPWWNPMNPLWWWAQAGGRVRVTITGRDGNVVYVRVER